MSGVCQNNITNYVRLIKMGVLNIGGLYKTFWNNKEDEVDCVLNMELH